MLANLSANEITREKVRTIVPCSDLAEARTELEKTNDAFQLSVQFGAPPFHAFQDMRMGLRRAKSGARLSLKDLLEIATVLRQIQSLSDWYDRCSGVESSLDDLFSQLAPVPYLLEKLDYDFLIVFSNRISTMLDSLGYSCVKLHFYLTEADFELLNHLGFSTSRRKLKIGAFLAEIRGMDERKATDYLLERYSDFFLE